jgi:hypothetical protein
MTQHIDWLPRRREEQIALSKNWQTILTTAKVSAWNIPTAEVSALKNLTTAGESTLLQLAGGESAGEQPCSPSSIFCGQGR